MSEPHSRTISSETSNCGCVVRNSERRRARRWDYELPLLNTEDDVPCTPGQTWEIMPIIPSQVRSPTPFNSCGRYVRIPQNDDTVQSPSASNEIRTYHVSETDDKINEINTRKRKLELQAAEAAACVKKRALIEQKKIELDLLSKRLSLELATNAVTGVCIESLQESNLQTVDLFERSITEQQSTTSRDKDDDENKNVHRRVANRLAEDKSLPVFNGNPLEWLRFKSIYNDSENVVRLYNSSVGEARDAVDAFIVTACTAEQIIETLRLRFGNPENVLRKFVEDVKSTPKVNSGPGFTLLATKVGNAVAAMQSLNHQGYLHSSELVEEILAKLSEPVLIHYIHYASSNDTREPRLVILSKFLRKESDAAYVAGTSMFNAKIPSTHKSSKYGFNSKHVFSITERGQQESGRCLYCKEENHHICDCTDFASLPNNNRWNWIKTKGVCFRCLNPGHNRWKCRAPYCPVNGCGRPHHVLLHNDSEISGSINRRVMPSRERAGNQIDNPVIARIASLTPQTIPRLELQAALIGSRLAQMVQTEHEYQISERTFWKDSRTVLIWIWSDPTEYNAFVSHRLAEIDELTNPLEWKWTPSNMNPADQPTKTVNTNWSVEGNWFSGPAFLRLPKSQWPKQPQLSKDCMENAARSESKVVLTCRFEHVFNLKDTLPDIQKFSRFLRLIRASARVLLCVDLLLKGQTQIFSQ